MLSAADQHSVGLLAVGTLVWGDERGIGLLVVSFGVIFQTTQKQMTLTPNLGIRFLFKVLAHHPDAALLRVSATRRVRCPWANGIGGNA